MKKERKEYLEVIAEDINSKFDIVLEGLKALNEKMDRGFLELKTDLAEFKVETRYNFSLVFERLDGLEELRELKPRVEKIERRLAKIPA